MVRARLLPLAVLAASAVGAQVPVPFTAVDGRSMVFADGRFEELATRPPQAVYAMEGQVVFADHEDRLMLFAADGRKWNELEGPATRTVKATRSSMAWTCGDTLKVLRGGKAVVVAMGVARFTVSDSLVVFHDTVHQELRALWRGDLLTLATVTRTSEADQWTQGGALATFFEKETRRLFLLRHGTVRTLCDSTDVGIAAVGHDLVAYWDDRSDQFRVNDGEDHEVSGLRPVSAKAGKGVLAYVDGAGGLRCWTKGGRVHRLTDTIPTAYWVQEGLVLFVRGNYLHLFDGEHTVLVERYVPERWQVEDGRLVYLDINRELRGIVGGQRVRFGTEANIAHFDLFGDAVVYRSPSGLTTVVRGGRSYTF